MPRQKLLPRVPRNKRTGAAILLVLMVFGWLMFARGGRRQPIQPSHPKGVADHVPSGKPPVVIVTVLDTSDHPKMYIDSVKENRKRYAELHGMYLVMVYDTSHVLFLTLRLHDRIWYSGHQGWRLRPSRVLILLDQSCGYAPRHCKISRCEMDMVRPRGCLHYGPQDQV